MMPWGLPFIGHRTASSAYVFRNFFSIRGQLGLQLPKVQDAVLFLCVFWLVLQNAAVTSKTLPLPVCGDNLTASAGHLSQTGEDVISTQHCDKSVCHQCVYFIHAPSKERTIALNFTSIYGFRNNSSGNCLPKVDIMELDPETGARKTTASICKENNNLHTPQAFHFQKGSVKLTYIWPHGQYHCGFQVEYSFPMCGAKCDDGSCLETPVLLCNGRIDCKDGSDESTAKCQPSSKSVLPTTPFSSRHYTSPKDFTYIILITIIVFTVLLASSVIAYIQCFRPASAPPRGQSYGHNQLRPHPHLNQPGSGVIYLPGPVSEDFNHHDRPKESVKDRQLQNVTLNLPPSIPISLDGEEGYDRCYPYQSTALTHRLDRDSVCPPPNRTIYDGESPPPYRSHSVGRLDRPNSRLSVPSRGSIRDCSESPRVERCYSMSNNNKPRNMSVGPTGVTPYYHQINQQHQQQPRRTRHSTGHSPTTTTRESANSDREPPPGYSEVILGDYQCVDTAENPTNL